LALLAKINASEILEKKRLQKFSLFQNLSFI